jgi:predicted transcriptional regulator
MLPEISEIKSLRKKAKMTQAFIAEKTGVSQSLIAKIEAQKVMPAYDKAKKLFDFFESVVPNQEKVASDFMTRKVVSVKPYNNVKEAVKIMKKYAVSQLPVIDDDKNLGVVSEENLLKIINSDKDMDAAKNMLVQDVMSEAMPIVQKNTPYHVLSSLLEYNKGVLVGEKGRIIGIITKSDLLNAVIEKTM